MTIILFGNWIWIWSFIFLSLSLLTHLRESLGNKAVYSQPFVSFPGVGCAFVFKCSSFFYPECPKKFHVHVLGSLCHKNLCSSPVMFFSTLFLVFSSGSFTHIYFHSGTSVPWFERSRSFLVFWSNRSSRLLLFLFVGPSSSEAEHVFSIHKHANIAHMGDWVD